MTDDDLDDEDDTGDSASEGEDATAPCPHCGEEIYEDTFRCPACGMYLSDGESSLKPRTWWVLVVAICILIVLAWAWSGQ